MPEAERLDALHQLFYGFYSRIAIVDRTTHELARWARDDLAFIANLTEPMAEALRDNALHVGQDLFGARMRAMAALRLVSARMAELREPGTNPAFTQRWALAFDEQAGQIRTYDLAQPGEHPGPALRPLQLRPGRRVSADQVAARPPRGIDEYAVRRRSELQAVARRQLVHGRCPRRSAACRRAPTAAGG